MGTLKSSHQAQDVLSKMVMITYRNYVKSRVALMLAGQSSQDVMMLNDLSERTNPLTLGLVQTDSCIISDTNL